MTKKDRLAWWRAARFGMFIHWGLYALPAGTWKGKAVPGIGEWIMRNAGISVGEYEQLARRFNPAGFNAGQWVEIARRAGMRYLVITAKHHDGFAMFDSPCDPYNIVAATPFGRDPLQELARACREAGLRLCFYYSHAQDWHAPGGAGKIEESVSGDWSKPAVAPRAFARYLEEKAKPQIRELLTRYGPVGLIWFDTPIAITPQQSRDLRDFVHRLQPDCLVSGRVGHGFGDYNSLGDNQFPAGKIKGDWETPATMNDTWGFKAGDHNWKSIETLLGLLAGCAGRGGNYLLNVGPTARGIIPPASVVRLKKIGAWLRVNGEAVYGTQASPYDYDFDWGWITRKTGRLFLLFRKWPGNGRFVLHGLRNRVRRVRLLAKPGQPVRFAQAFDRQGGYSDLKLLLPRRKTGRYISVVALEIAGRAKVYQKNLLKVSAAPVINPDGSAGAGRLTIRNPYGTALKGRIKLETPPELRVSLVNKVVLPPRKSLTVPFQVRVVRPFSQSRRIRFLLFRSGLQRASLVLKVPPPGFSARILVSRPMPGAAKLGSLAYPRNRARLKFRTREFSPDGQGDHVFYDLHNDLFNCAPRDVLVYFACPFSYPRPVKLDLCLGYDGPVKVWIDGQERYHDPAGTNPAIPDKAVIPLDVAAGRHEALIALGSNHGKAWGLFCRLGPGKPAGAAK